MNAPAFEVVRGDLVAIHEEPTDPARLELLRIRALKLGHSSDIVQTESGPVLSLSVYTGKPGASRCFGFINVYPATEADEERWSLMATCDAVAGLPMQADWLVEGAKRLRDAFTALVAS